MIKHVNPAKASIVETLKDLLSKSKSVAVVDYKGLKVSQATELRKAIKKAGGQYVVAKNTLFKIASHPFDLKLGGISGFVFSLTDEVSALKAVAEFAKKNTVTSGPVFKSGLLGDRVLTASEVSELSSVPDPKTSMSKLVFVLNWNIGQLVRTLDAVAKSKEVTN